MRSLHVHVRPKGRRNDTEYSRTWEMNAHIFLGKPEVNRKFPGSYLAFGRAQPGSLTHPEKRKMTKEEKQRKKSRTRKTAQAETLTVPKWRSFRAAVGSRRRRGAGSRRKQRDSNSPNKNSWRIIVYSLKNRKGNSRKNDTAWKWRGNIILNNSS